VRSHVDAGVDTENVGSEGQKNDNERNAKPGLDSADAPGAMPSFCMNTSAFISGWSHVDCLGGVLEYTSARLDFLEPERRNETQAHLSLGATARQELPNTAMQVQVRKGETKEVLPVLTSVTSLAYPGRKVLPWLLIQGT